MKKNFISVLLSVCMLAALVPDMALAADVPQITYQAHVQDVGWMSTVSDGQTAGTTGRAKQMEALKINLNNGDKSAVQYRVHMADKGWGLWVPSGTMAGTTGQSRAIEGVQIKLTGNYANDYDIYYRVHVEEVGWLGWAKNGQTAGSTGLALRVEAIEIKVIKKGVIFLSNSKYSNELTKPALTYQAHCQDYGWKAKVGENKVAGTTGEGKRLEALIINLKNFDGGSGISYRTHVSDIGWGAWVESGKTSGTTGQSKAIEAVEIKLSSPLDACFDIYYRMHVKDKGWLGWAKNGQTAGTTGGGIQAEAIQIQIVNKGVPFNTGGAAYINATGTTTVNTGSGLINSNLSKVSLIKQGSKTCKASAVAQSLNIIVGYDKYTTSSMGGNNCNNINGNIYRGSDGNQYIATYKKDTYVGSASEQQSKIDEAIAANLPIVVAVHKTTAGTKKHWVTIIGKSGNTYEIIDPATGTRRTMSSAKYAFGATQDGYCYGYVSFKRR